MERNFVIGGAVAIEAEECVHDLHNFYDFKELKIDASRNSVGLLFTLNPEVKKNSDDKEVAIRFLNVDYFELSPNFASRLTRDLEEIGFKNPDDRDIDWLIGEDKATQTDHILFRFSNDEYVRVHAEKAYVCIVTKGQEL